MKNSEVQPLIDFVQESFELVQSIKDAAEDKKLKLIEGWRIFQEAKDVFDSIKSLQGVEVSKLNENDIQQLSTVVMDSIDKEVQFLREDVASVLRIAQNITEMITRTR